MLVLARSAAAQWPVAPQPLGSFSQLPHDVVSYQGEAFFGGTTSSGGTSLWRCDGTALGTAVAAAMPAMPTPVLSHLKVVDDYLYFVDGNQTLYEARETPGGLTTRAVPGVAPIPTTTTASITATNYMDRWRFAPLQNLNDKLFFFTPSYSTSTGRVNSRYSVMIPGASTPTVIADAGVSTFRIFIDPLVIGDQICFGGLLGTTFAPPNELIVSDGTAAGTRIAARLPPEPGDSYVRWTTALPNGRLLVSAGANSGQLAVVDPQTGISTPLVSTLTTGPYTMPGVPWQGDWLRPVTGVDGKAYFDGSRTDPRFGAQSMPWVTDGTPGGTRPVLGDAARLPDGTSVASFFVRADHTVFFNSYGTPTGSSPVLYNSLFRTSGTPHSTVQILQINDASPATELTASTAISVAGYHFSTRFVKPDGVTSKLRYYLSDGTPSGTLALAEFSITGAPFVERLLNPAAATDDLIVYFVYDDTGNGGTEPITLYSIRPPKLTTWNVDADGFFATASNWTRGVANEPGAVLNFTGITRAARTVTIETPINAGKLVFDSSHAYTLAGPGTITLDGVTSAQSWVYVFDGSHDVAAPIVSVDDLHIETVETTSVRLADVSMPGKVLRKRGVGAARVDSLVAGSVAVDAGTLRLGDGPARVAAISVDPSATLLLAPANAVVVDYDGASPLAALRALVTSGDIQGATPSLAVGYIDTSSPDAPVVPGVDASAVLLRATLAGDANLDAVVNFDDLLVLAANYNTATGEEWFTGDFTGDGATNFDDLLSLAANYNQTALAGDWALALAASVPEPAATASAVAVACGSLRRRRRIAVSS